MTETLLIVAIILLAVVVVLQIALFFRKVQLDLSPFQVVEKAHERTERAVREEIAKNREESSNAARQSREEIANTLKGVGDSLTKQLGTQAQANDQKLAAVRETVEKRLTALQEASAAKLDEIRKESTASAQKSREEVSKTINDFVNWQRGQFAAIVEQFKALTESNEKRLGEVRTTLEAKLKTMQEENAKQ